jgi:hypothetical protein
MTQVEASDRDMADARFKLAEETFVTHVRKLHLQQSSIDNAANITYYKSMEFVAIRRPEHVNGCCYCGPSVTYT